MKRIKFLIIIILNIVFFSNTFADERNQQLDGLFKELKTGEMLSNLTIEQKQQSNSSKKKSSKNPTKIHQSPSKIRQKSIRGPKTPQDPPQKRRHFCLFSFSGAPGPPRSPKEAPNSPKDRKKHPKP